MAILSMNYHSPTLGMHQHFMVILPEDATYFDPNQQPKQLKTLLLLHGLSSDETTYMRYTSIERYANDHQLAVIMPNADHSGYSNMVYGHRYFDYALELSDYLHQILPLSTAREDNFIAGHSMGGYGTIKFALTHGERFAKAVPLSAVFSGETLMNYEWTDFSGEAIAGDPKQVIGTALDPYHLVDEALEHNQSIPQLLIMCGTEDELYEDNQQFLRYLDEKGVNYQFEDGPGEHDYAYWDRAIERAIQWLTEA
ncbi:putative tributyrin esterase [Staphylococcus auricularis]|uniref:Alpha/beta hydrolase family protein n=1 Tax=Staphylococcus auricularis TaxID=29379 RepID=A0AAP8PN69_9STAP|nr:alpha/beta hydrolase family protein [Staphylococcus auricularis]MBM0868456.1 esterase family protein [Staphylococcus auricularis]MCG7342412.1 esterase family protein [Staphylococcus auricularis]MDC6328170.1 alpha/beta hydrolase family protein [Staphylococcus auricularis]MDN4533219.1 alpha/beta hydrolase family protein [Staphylococcus auricularis]PNZ66528.1 tributyrin esterase [Staphylococcus auricularis]